MKIDLTDEIAIAQLTFVLLLIAVFLMFLVFGKIERQLKPPHKEKQAS